MTSDRFRLLAVYQALNAMHGWREWHWWPDADPFEVIVGAVLVQNTAWANVERALDNLRAAAALDPVEMRRLDESALEALVRPSGQYRQKTRKLREVLALIDEAGGLERLFALPSEVLRRRLLATWGIGEETADCILLYAARRPSFVVDAYTVRLFRRLGLGPEGAPGYAGWKEYFQRSLRASEETGERDLWARYHALVVMHCKHLCRKRAPRCGECVLARLCPAAEVTA